MSTVQVINQSGVTSVVDKGKDNVEPRSGTNNQDTQGESTKKKKKKRRKIENRSSDSNQAVTDATKTAGPSETALKKRGGAMLV